MSLPRQQPERRKWPRPPLWLNLLLLAIAAAIFIAARHEREVIRQKTALLFQPAPKSSDELNRVREQLADMNLTRGQLARELDAKADYLHALQSEEFYLAIDTAKRKLSLRIGKDVVREADVEIGPAKTITGNGRTWTFVPLKGGFNVVSKTSDYDWTVPEWWYVMNHETAPARRPMIPEGLGHYVIVLPDNYLIHSPPPDASPLHGQPKPGSFMMPEGDLAAIWQRVTKGTRVYIF
ncbi:MAG TPA: hypothetical protein VII75_06295 [Thermoanaerobaculia bacterium]